MTTTDSLIEKPQDLPGKIYIWRQGDDEPVNGMFLECDDPENKGVAYLRADIVTANALRLTAEIVKYRTALNQIAWPPHFPSDKEPRDIAITALRIGA